MVPKLDFIDTHEGISICVLIEAVEEALYKNFIRTCLPKARVDPTSFTLVLPDTGDGETYFAVGDDLSVLWKQAELMEKDVKKLLKQNFFPQFRKILLNRLRAIHEPEQEKKNGR